MTSTIFDETAYDDGIRAAITEVVDEWGFRYLGIPDVEHVYFCAATSATPERIGAYLDQAYQLGHEFDRAWESPRGRSPRRTRGRHSLRA